MKRLLVCRFAGLDWTGLDWTQTGLLRVSNPAGPNPGGPRRHLRPEHRRRAAEVAANADATAAEQRPQRRPLLPTALPRRVLPGGELSPLAPPDHHHQ
eukprot:1559097-Pyramimonas_sp.AAC.2